MQEGLYRLEEQKVSILIVDDDGDHRELYIHYLKKSTSPTFAIEEAASADEAATLLQRYTPDCMLLDYRLPAMDGLRFLDNYREENWFKKTAIIILTAHGNETIAVEAMKKGAMDYLVKGRLDGDSLIRTIRFAVRQKKNDLERDRLFTDLQQARENVKRLKGLLPICARCKKIRDDDGYWQQLEKYIEEHSDAEISHSLCPGCLDQLYPDYAKKIKSK
ncbi:MAG: hypothetical protein CVV44_12080 [Spirochaetae bacterium HGW-Spirochaetae-1]|nr:MAG: hypothetical protein CVV44_12080 [Spirochaetae bacterium HGW-Spirochaetae-1]